MCLSNKRRQALMKEFELLRSRIEHEDQLVNHRLGWMLAFTGFLFTAYSLSFAPAVNLLRVPDDQGQQITLIKEQIRWLRLVFAITGVGVSFAALVGIMAANRAILDCAISDREKYEKLKSFQFVFPIGHDETSRAGMFSNIAFPCITMAIWLTIIVATLCSFSGWMVAGSLFIAALVAGTLWQIVSAGRARQLPSKLANEDEDV